MRGNRVHLLLSTLMMRQNNCRAESSCANRQNTANGEKSAKYSIFTKDAANSVSIAPTYLRGERYFYCGIVLLFRPFRLPVVGVFSGRSSIPTLPAFRCSSGYTLVTPATAKRRNWKRGKCTELILSLPLVLEIVCQFCSTERILKHTWVCKDI